MIYGSVEEKIGKVCGHWSGKRRPSYAGGRSVGAGWWIGGLACAMSRPGLGEPSKHQVPQH